MPLPAVFSPAAVPSRPAAAGAGAAAAPAQPSGACPDNNLFLHCQAFGAGYCASTDCKLIHDAHRAEAERTSWLAESLPNVVGWGQMDAVIARPGSGGVLPGAAPGVPPVLLIAGESYMITSCCVRWQSRRGWSVAILFFSYEMSLMFGNIGIV